jgi:hypothetical protein
MKNQNLVKKILPFVIAIIAFVIISFAFFNPVLEGKMLKQSDVTIFRGMSKEIKDYRETHGDEPLWTNGMFSGMPTYQITTKYPNNWVRKIDKVLRLGLPRPVDYLWLYFIGFFILLLALKVDPWLALVGSIGFGFSTYFIIIIEAGHNSKAHAIAYMAPILGSVIMTYRGKYLLGGILTAFFAALEIATNHFQITYYLLLILLIMAIYIFFDYLKNKMLPQFFKASGVLIIAAILAILPNITNLWVTMEYSAQSMRGKSELVTDANNQTSGLDKNYATQWSYGIGESWSLLFPNVKGGGSGVLAQNEKAMEKVDPRLKQSFTRVNSYWGDQPFTSGPTYAGAIIVFLFVLGLFYVKGWLKWSLLTATILGLTLAWGKNFMPLTEFFLDYFPLYNKFRAVSMILVIAEFAIPVLAMLAIWEVVKNPKIIQEKRNQFFIAFGLTGGLLLLFFIMPTVFFNFLSQMEEEQLSGNARAAEFVANMELARITIFKADAMRSFIFILLIAAALYVYSINKINKTILIIIFGVLLLGDLFSINRRYVNDENYDRKRNVENPYKASEADKAILEDTDPHYRVLNLNNPFNDGGTSYFHKSIGGYHSAKLGKYQELIDHRLQGELSAIIETLQSDGGFLAVDQQLKNSPTINMLNTKYIIYNPQAQPILNPYANGNAWFPQKIEWVENANEEMARIGEVNSKTTSVIDQRYKNEIGNIVPSGFVGNSIQLTEYQPNYLKYESTTTSKQLAVFSEMYYNKGWNAYIDGEWVPHYRVDYTLRGLVIPEGKHVVEFKFLPKSYFTGEKFALVGSILLVLALIGIIGKELKFYFRKDDEQA